MGSLEVSGGRIGCAGGAGGAESGGTVSGRCSKNCG